MTKETSSEQEQQWGFRSLMGALANRIGLARAAGMSFGGERDLFDALGYKPGQKVCRASDKGCSNCSNTGYRGRVGIHELLTATDELKELIYRKAKAAEIRELAIEQGMRTLKQDGIEKVLKGLTTLDKVRAVCSR